MSLDWSCILSVVIYSVSLVAGEDPCQTELDLFHSKRLSSYTIGNDDAMFCDQINSEWYKLTNATISNYCVKNYQCSTLQTMWVNSPLPTDYQQTSVQLCLNRNGDCCYLTTQILVQKCRDATLNKGFFYVYKLKPPQGSGCYFGFCIDLDCPAGQGLNSGICSATTSSSTPTSSVKPTTTTTTTTNLLPTTTTRTTTTSPTTTTTASTTTTSTTTTPTTTTPTTTTTTTRTTTSPTTTTTTSTTTPPTTTTSTTTTPRTTTTTPATTTSVSTTTTRPTLSVSSMVSSTLSSTQTTTTKSITTNNEMFLLSVTPTTPITPVATTTTSAANLLATVPLSPATFSIFAFYPSMETTSPTDNVKATPDTSRAFPTTLVLVVVFSVGAVVLAIIIGVACYCNRRRTKEDEVKKRLSVGSELGEADQRYVGVTNGVFQPQEDDPGPMGTSPEDPDENDYEQIENQGDPYLTPNRLKQEGVYEHIKKKKVPTATLR